MSNVRVRLIRLLLGVTLFFMPALASAVPITFNFTFQSSETPAQATGTVIFESSLLPNPGCTDLFIPGPAVIALNVTVSGASSGNGTFTRNDFDQIAWCTQGATLDFNRELVGQPTSRDPWGTPSGNGGDFNLFDAHAPAPKGQWYFTLCADAGEEDCMELITMRRVGVGPLPAAPVASAWGLVLLVVMLGALGVRVLSRSRGQAALRTPE